MIKKNKFWSFVPVCLICVICFTFLLTGCGDGNLTQEIKVSTFTELQQAVQNIENGGKVVLEDDITIEDAINVNKRLTLDLNGKTINNAQDLWIDEEDVDRWSLISVKESGNLTIVGNGKLKAKADDCYAIDIVDGGKCLIKSGEFVGNISAVYVYNGILNIEGGKFSIQQKATGADGERFTLNCSDEAYKNSSARIFVKGGTFENFNPSDCKAEGEHTNFVVSGFKVEKVADTNDYAVVENE